MGSLIQRAAGKWREHEEMRGLRRAAYLVGANGLEYQDFLDAAGIPEERADSIGCFESYADGTLVWEDDPIEYVYQSGLRMWGLLVQGIKSRLHQRALKKREEYKEDIQA